jgi:non-specific serine/threonine protein kinase/serine/threonine-protein kinase
VGTEPVPAGGLETTAVVATTLPDRVPRAGSGGEGSGPASWVGEVVDGYRILRLIGAGGMGVVYLAQQQHPKRLVAIKTLHAGLHQPELLARFHQEAEILARLKHPGIAQIHASGRTGPQLGNVPYIVMEYVEGEQLLAYSGGLDTRERLELLMRICAAVEHAHIRGVIHRDLKPGNILVQADGQPKVLDFGVARLSGEDRGAGGLTSAGMLIGTIAYMSPEQAIGDTAGIDIRSDVYALGMIGYRMLAGEMPYEVSGQNLQQALEQICHQAPVPLSRHDRRLAGDVETIVGKALAKDKEARYQNAAELAEDLRRHLADEAILARPPSVLSQIRRFARRNKVLVGAALAVVLSLIGAVAVSTRYALQEQAQRREADALAGYMRAMFSSANPALAQGRAVTIGDFIGDAGQRLESELAQAPAARARLRTTLAETHKALGDLPRAIEYYRAAQRDFATAQVQGVEFELAIVGEARALLDSGRVREARQRLDGLLDAAAGGPVTAPRASARLHLAAALTKLGEYENARASYTAGLAALARVRDEDCPGCLPGWSTRLEIWARSLLSELESQSGDLPAALAAAESAHALARERLGESDPDTQLALVHVALAHQAAGATDQALALLRPALAERERLLGSSHWQTLTAANNLAWALEAAGQAAEAEQVYRDALAKAVQGLDRARPELATLEANLGHLLFASGRVAEAEVLMASAHARRIERLGPSHPDTLKSARNLAVLYTTLAKSDPGRFDDAERLMRMALEGSEERFGPEHRQTIEVRSEFASVLRDRGRYAEADREFQQAWTLAESLLPEGDNERLRVLFQYSGSLQRQARWSEAETWSARLLRERERASRPDAAHAQMAPLRHARSLIGLARFDEAEALLRAVEDTLAAGDEGALARNTRATLAELELARSQAARSR